MKNFFDENFFCKMKKKCSVKATNEKNHSFSMVDNISLEKEGDVVRLAEAYFG